jgi:hypothetical protein
MKNSYENSQDRSKANIEYKSSASFLYQKFLSIDKRIRRNLVIGVSMITIVLGTGIVLALISLVQFGGILIDHAFAEGKKETLKSISNKDIQKDVEKNLLHIDKLYKN